MVMFMSKYSRSSLHERSCQAASVAPYAKPNPAFSLALRYFWVGTMVRMLTGKCGINELLSLLALALPGEKGDGQPCGLSSDTPPTDGGSRLGGMDAYHLICS